MLIWGAFKWIFAFAIGFLILSQGSYALFDLVNPLGAADVSARLPALREQALFLVAATAAGNLLLSLVAGYTVGVISNQHWRSNCVALAAAAVALTHWETRFLVPLVNSWFLVFVSADGVWLSMVPVPLGLLAGGYARSRQSSALWLGTFFATLAGAAAIALLLFLASVP